MRCFRVFKDSFQDLFATNKNPKTFCCKESLLESLKHRELLRIATRRRDRRGMSSGSSVLVRSSHTLEIDFRRFVLYFTFYQGCQHPSSAGKVVVLTSAISKLSRIFQKIKNLTSAISMLSRRISCGSGGSCKLQVRFPVHSSNSSSSSSSRKCFFPE